VILDNFEVVDAAFLLVGELLGAGTRGWSLLVTS
jgi:hypothetical protein